MLDPTGHAAYSIGNPTAPEQYFDEDYSYDPGAEATFEDYASWAKWGAMLTGAGIFKNMPDACAAYANYRSGTGADLSIDYDRAISEDSGIRQGVLGLITEAQTSVEGLRANGSGNSFSITGSLYGIPNGTTENWQKTIGAHYAWASADVNYSDGQYSMTITMHVMDRYNFNKGMADIASGTPDSVNGRFATLGWAKSFNTVGQATRVVTWTEGNIGNSTNIVYGNGR